jgi:hypothetical protein
MKKTILLAGLCAAVLFLNSCHSAQAVDSLQKAEPTAEKQPESLTKQLPVNQKVNFKGVSFSYNPQIFGEVKIEEIDEAPLGGEDYKPDENFPKHVEFLFEKTKHSTRARIAIVPIADYRRMFAVSNYLTKEFDKNLTNVQKAIKNKSFRVKNEIPIMPFYDAHQTFIAKVKHFSFQNGSGILFLSQINQEATLVNNEGLIYYFQGLTADKKNYIFAVFSVRVSFLPDSFEASEFEGYKLPTYYKERDVKGYKNYISKITKRLENLPSDRFEPDLKYFEEIVSSLKVE